MRTFREWRTSTIFLDKEPRKTCHDPVKVGEEEYVVIDLWVVGEGEEEREIQSESEKVTP